MQLSLSSFLSKFLIPDICSIIISYDAFIHRHRYDHPQGTLCTIHYRNYRLAISSGQYHRAYRITIHCKYMKYMKKQYNFSYTCIIPSIQSMKRVKCSDQFCKIMLIKQQLHDPDGDYLSPFLSPYCKDHGYNENGYIGKKSVFARHCIQ